VADDNWHEVSLLTISYLGIIQQHDRVASMVVDRLIARAPGEPGAAVVLAGECVLDAWPGGVTPACKQVTIQQLLATMRAGPETSPATRAAAGRLLARLGDPRVEVLDPLRIEWCDVPAGPFRMGSQDDPEAFDSEKLQHEMVIPYAFRMARYPVTNAQYRCFVDAGGYAVERYWREAHAAGFWRDGLADSRSGPAEYGEPFTLPNHPVVGVTWYEALAFTRWLSDALREQGQLPQGWQVRLPSEAEWEKAARGADGRCFPWGETLTPQHANYVETGIGATNAVGCFPSGAGPHRCEEMSGNVWEWTRSLWGDDPDKPEYGYPYDPADGRERLDAGILTCRVVRGGLFLNYVRFVRCAARFPDLPFYRLGDYGFRVVLSPSPLDDEASGR